MPRFRSSWFALLALIGPAALATACSNAGRTGDVTDDEGDGAGGDDEGDDDGAEQPQGGKGGAPGRGGAGGGAAGAGGSEGTTMGGAGGNAGAAGGAAGAPQGGAGAEGEAGAGGQAPTMRPPWKGEGPPKELGDVVPVFVAAGFGARTVISCDDGRTWKAQHQLANDNADHSPYTHKGLAYGNGTFVQLIGWGAEGSVKVSTDGVTWERRTVSAGGMGGIGFADGAFVLVESFGSRVSTDGGKTWTAGGATGHGYHVRGGGGGGPGVIAGGGSGQTAVTSWDKGKTWAKASDCPPMKHHNLGQYGGAAWGAGGLVLVSDDGQFCKLTDRRAVGKGKLPSFVFGKVSWVGDHFVVANVGRNYESDDGLTWTNNLFKPVGTKINAIARGDSGTYVGVDGTNTGFYRSTDGITWEKVTGPSGPSLVDVVFGWAKPSAACPK